MFHRKVLSRLVTSLAPLLVSFSAMADDAAVPWIRQDVWDTPYNKIAQVACHNCYEPQYASTFKSVLNYVRTVEIDFWDESGPVLPNKRSGYWFVRHSNFEAPYGDPNLNNCTNGKDTIKGGLRGCLQDLKNWSDENPGHFPITVILDKKQSWSPANQGRAPQDLDNLLVEIFGDAIFSDFDLANYVGSNGSQIMKTFIIGKDWPTARQLKGKFIFVFNHEKNWAQDDYHRGRITKMFMAPNTQSLNDITGDITDISTPVGNWVMMNNMHSSGKLWAQSVFAVSHIGRVWGDDSVSFADHITERVHLSAYYDFANAKDANGFRIRPF